MTWKWIFDDKLFSLFFFSRKLYFSFVFLFLNGILSKQNVYDFISFFSSLKLFLFFSNLYLFFFFSFSIEAGKPPFDCFCYSLTVLYFWSCGDRKICSIIGIFGGFRYIFSQTYSLFFFSSNFRAFTHGNLVVWKATLCGEAVFF